MATEQLIHLTNSEGVMASAAMLRVTTDQPQRAVELALRRGYSNFVVIQRDDSPEGFSDNMKARVVDGKPATVAGRKFLFVDDDGHIDVELWVEAPTKREARKLAWAQLTDEQRDACGCLECVDEAAI